MISNEIRTNAAALGVLMHEVNNEQAALIRIVLANLAAAADQAEEFERHLVVPQPASRATASEGSMTGGNELKEAV